MLKDENSHNYEGRNLSDVFKELEQTRNESIRQQIATKHKKKKRHNIFDGQAFSFQSNVWWENDNPQPVVHTKTNDLSLLHIITGCSILIVSLAIFFPKSTSFTESYAKSDDIVELSNFELNRHRLNIQNIISENSNMDRVKEQVIEDREVGFETNYTNKATLPKGEEKVIQEGANGTHRVEVVKTYENGELIEEILLGKQVLVESTPKIIELGTSEFLAKNRAHLNDTLYLLKNANIKAAPDDNSEDVAEVEQYLDVTLTDLPSEDWAKVTFDSIEGYIKTSNITSSYASPTVVESNRIKRILLTVNIDMELNKTSGLSLTDYEKIFKNLPNDTNHIFEKNYQVFYNMEKKYKINGIFLAAIAIHESDWGRSQIAKDKNNLFGYGSYDSSPYESSFDFDDYSEGIETVAKSLVKYYLNPSGTKIYDGEKADGKYFNGPTLSGVNTRYASDKEWYKKVFKHMETLYNRLTIS